jgi:transglutaminase-like putative cysteine protease
MQIAYGYRIDIVTDQPTPVIAMLDLHPERAVDAVVANGPRVTALSTGDEIDAQGTYRDQFGNICRRIVAPAGGFSIQTDGIVRDTGHPDQVDPLAEQVAPELLPHETLVYLLGSRYCETDLLSQEAWSRFGHFQGGHARVQAICDFTHRHIRFDYTAARATRSAHDAFREGVGVCRDYAHLALTLCRCLNIPARYCTGYLGDIGVPADPAPGDFSGWFEAFIGGRWWTFDARHNTPRIGRILIARGRDATDVPIFNSFGAHSLRHFEVFTHALPEEGPLAVNHETVRALGTTPMIQTPAA